MELFTHQTPLQSQDSEVKTHIYISIQHNGHSHTDEYCSCKNLSQSIIICVEHQNFSKSIRQPCQNAIFGDARASSGFLYATPLQMYRLDKIQYNTIPEISPYSPGL